MSWLLVGFLRSDPLAHECDWLTQLINTATLYKGNQTASLPRPVFLPMSEGK